MFKRVGLVATVVAAFFVLAVPAMAFNGFRDTFVLTGQCQGCHFEGGFAPPIYDEWVETAHANTHPDAVVRGAGCAGCHVGNYDPEKHVPTAPGVYPTAVEGTQGSGMSGFSEAFVGCSSCHYGVNTGTDPTANDLFGNDPANTAHLVPTQNMASAEICGQCHSRYSQTVAEYPAWTWPSGAPSPAATVVRPEYTLGDFNPLGAAPDWSPAPITDFLEIPTPDNPVKNAFWEGGQSAKAHGQGAVQYEEWMGEGHANALTGLTGQSFWAFLPEDTKKGCLECHSTDFVMMQEAGEDPASADAEGGITCVGCHKPHEESAQSAAWNEEKDPQLKAPRQKLCIQCHNGELPEGEEATPGTELHHPMKEMMAGYGAIGVDQIPSVHEGKCVQCHMIPTGYEYNGHAGSAGNHVFAIVTPEEADSQTTATATGPQNMPYSSCSTCHGRATDPLATYLDETIVQRQTWTKDKIAIIWDELDVAAGKLGYADAAAAHEALVAIPESKWTGSQRSFLSAFTNVEFVESEGSFGLHNWAYSVQIVNRAHQQAQAVIAPAPRPRIISIRASRSSVTKGRTTVVFLGAAQDGWGFAASGKLTLQRRMAGKSWRNWKTLKLASNGTYRASQRLNFARGKWQFRARMAGDGGLNLTATSRTVAVRVR